MVVKDSFDYVKARAFLSEKAKHQAEKRCRLWHQAVLDTKHIVNMVIEEFTPLRILQWGSVLNEKDFSEISDIDLAIEGVDSVLFMRLQEKAEKMTKFPLDLLRWEDVDPCFRRLLKKKGCIIYEKR